MQYPITNGAARSSPEIFLKAALRAAFKNISGFIATVTFLLIGGASRRQLILGLHLAKAIQPRESQS